MVRFPGNNVRDYLNSRQPVVATRITMVRCITHNHLFGTQKIPLKPHVSGTANKVENLNGKRRGGWLERVLGSRYVFWVAHRIPS